MSGGLRLMQRTCMVAQSYAPCRARAHGRFRGISIFYDYRIDRYN